MAFAVTSWKSYAIPTDQPTIQRFAAQKVVFTVTAAATDVAWAMGNLAAGDFWADAAVGAINDATHGEKAVALRAYLQSLYPRAQFVKITSPELDTARVRAVAAGDGVYAAANDATTKIPSLTFHTAQSPTALTVELEFVLKTSEWPQAPATFGTNI